MRGGGVRVAADTGDQASSRPDVCGRCGGPISDPLDLETLAAEVDAHLTAEYKRPVPRTEWAGPPPDGLLHNLFPWWPGVRESRSVWQRGQALWGERVQGFQVGLCEYCREEGGATALLAPPPEENAEEPTRQTAPAAGPVRVAEEESATAAFAPSRPVTSAPAPPPREPTPASDDEHEARTIIAPLPAFATRGPRLVALEGPIRGHQFMLGRSTTTIGRSIACQVPIEDDDVGYQHARIVRRRESVTIEAVMGSGETLVNDEQVAAPRELRHGDVIRIGAARLRYEDEAAEDERAVPQVR